MLKLRTIHQYNLNDRLGDEYKKDNTNVLVDNKYPLLPRKHDGVSRVAVYKNNNSFSLDEFLIKL